jgi:hypothetical protein
MYGPNQEHIKTGVNINASCSLNYSSVAEFYHRIPPATHVW